MISVYPQETFCLSRSGDIKRDVSDKISCLGSSGQLAPLRLLMVTPRYHPFIGGVETHVHEVARRLANAGVDVTVLTTDPGGRLPVTERSEGVIIQRVRAWPGKEDFYFAPEIFTKIITGDWDVVHIQSYHTFVAPIAMLAAWSSGIPYVVTFHGGGHSSRLRNALRKLQYAILRPLMARAERLVATAEFEIRFFGDQLSLPADRFVLIPNGGDLSNEKKPDIQSNPKKALIISVGRLERYKGHHRVIEALPYILKRYPNMRLWIMGAGPYEVALRQLVQKLGVEDFVDIRAIPPSDRETMAAELSSAALVVLLSEYETHPMAVLEALTLGCSVLVADTSGLSELAAKGLAHAIPLESNSQQIAAAMLDQLAHPLVPPSIYLPSWDDCAAGLLALYKTVSWSPKCVS